MSEALDAVKSLTAVAEKLLHETERLRGDVARLNARLQPVEGEEDGYVEPPPPARAKWPVPEALNMIDQARRNILNCEHELSQSGLAWKSDAGQPHARHVQMQNLLGWTSRALS
jgi:hypothetical protein